MTCSDASPRSSYQVVAGDIRLSLTDFLLYCADSLGTPHSSVSASQELISLRDAFLSAGLHALKTATPASTWVQVGLEVAPGVHYAELYRRVAHTARDLLATPSVRNFFFMHKPPGLRVRFETAEAGNFRLADNLYNRLSTWQSDGVVERVVPGVYEPESHLFGGEQSMAYVHQLFTIDSLAWLDFHAPAASEGRDPDPAWAFSFVLLRALFNGLGITDLEDVDVWDRIRRKTGRSLPDEVLANVELATTAAKIRSMWLRHHSLLDDLSPRVQILAHDYQQAILPVTTSWRSKYFATRHASIGPRQAAAFFTIFHWNRAALSSERQALLTEALAARAKD